MGRLLRFHVGKRWEGPPTAGPPPPRNTLTLANKLQMLVLLEPVMAEEVVKLIDRLLTDTD